MQVRGYTTAFFFKGVNFSTYLLLVQPQATSLIAYNGYNKINQDYSHYTYYYQKGVVKFFFRGIHKAATAYKRLTNKFEYTLISCNLALNSLLTWYLNKEYFVTHTSTYNA